MPAGAAAGAALQYRMLAASGIDAPAAGSALTATTLVQLATLAAIPVLSLLLSLVGRPINHGLREAAWVGLGLFIVLCAIGAVLVKNKMILATGYNGAPAGLRHCDHTHGGDLLNGHCARSTHAEQNAIVQAARHGVSIEGATLYCSNNPCLTCAKLLINAGIGRVVYADGYPDQPAFDILSEAGIVLERMSAQPATGGAA